MSIAKKPLVAIIGRPNVGKSTLFNRILRKRVAIVHDQPGVTRDRHYAEAEWSGHEFVLIDTGGFFAGSSDVINQAVLRQIDEAVAEAHCLVFVTDGRNGLTAMDQEIARMLRHSGKPVLLAVNKIDDNGHLPALTEFYRLGLGEPFPISAVSGMRVGDFLDQLVQKLPPAQRPPAEPEAGREAGVEAGALQLAIVGRPNVGKSSLVNALLGQEKVIVTDIPGTTRDAIDTLLRYQNRNIVLIDTAGLRKAARVKEAVEFYSTVRTRDAIRRCEVAVVVVDATEGLTDQELHIITEIAQLHKGIILAINKWDLVEKDANTAREYARRIYAELRIYNYIPLLFVSALTGQRVFKLLELALQVQAERGREVRTSELNAFLQEAMQRYQPPAMDQREIKLNYCTQVKNNPPVFAIFCNHPTSIPRSYRQYLEKNFRARFGFRGVPITFTFRKK
ncbi:MAG: ribosome biogenesis GTPase Der [candidate division KSB1 bacterium]|nr:ribosome biogenesis GTPase Der [candidate division KSB1 bacterium]MDZ7273803.1 ribosome biogenesis GTPase Der [candidate division KSB1 bacterium]MDZ7285959.1 ribosome biogenesis GTPase Der [candidate division KSB1 bacterium]MDZ7298991.1 ribosome biogenesis GTPase Der [candidate division KSB1 bacterium]MDZ7309215.1 ribosome biogenesis GTPase Der [candidate division KSB1 bacterium]